MQVKTTERRRTARPTNYFYVASRQYIFKLQCSPTLQPKSVGIGVDFTFAINNHIKNNNKTPQLIKCCKQTINIQIPVQSDNTVNVSLTRISLCFPPSQVSLGRSQTSPRQSSRISMIITHQQLDDQPPSPGWLTHLVWKIVF